MKLPTTVFTVFYLQFPSITIFLYSIREFSEAKRNKLEQKGALMFNSKYDNYRRSHTFKVICLNYKGNQTSNNSRPVVLKLKNKED